MTTNESTEQGVREVVVRWDQRYRRLEAGEVILASDECQRDDGSWVPAVCVGELAPDPNYTSHRVYRRWHQTLASAPATLSPADIRREEAEVVGYQLLTPGKGWTVVLYPKDDAEAAVAHPANMISDLRPVYAIRSQPIREGEK